MSLGPFVAGKFYLFAQGRMMLWETSGERNNKVVADMNLAEGETLPVLVLDPDGSRDWRNEGFAMLLVVTKNAYGWLCIDKPMEEAP